MSEIHKKEQNTKMKNQTVLQICLSVIGLFSVIILAWNNLTINTQGAYDKEINNE